MLAVTPADTGQAAEPACRVPPLSMATQSADRVEEELEERKRVPRTVTPPATRAVPASSTRSPAAMVRPPGKSACRPAGTRTVSGPGCASYGAWQAAA